MPTKHARKLACEVVLEHFGEAVEKVCRVLVTRGQQSLGEVGRDTHLPPSQLRSCLLVLVQHNCVQALRHDADPTLPSARSQTQYVALLDSILQRLRFPKFLLHIRETMSEEAESLVEGLLEHGRLSVEQLLQRAQAHATGSEEEVEVAVKKAFAALVRGQYVERCPAAEPLVPQRYVSDVARKALRGGSRSRATVVAEGYFLAEEERIMQAAQAQDADRFRLPPTISAVADEDLDPSASPPHKATNGAATGVKRKRGAGEDNNVEVKEVLWRANYEEFMRRFRHKACVALVRERFDAVAGTVVAAVLDFGRAQETSVGQPSSASLSVEAVTHAVRSTAEGRTMPMDRVRQALQQLAADPAGLVQRSSDLGSAHYSIRIRTNASARRRHCLAVCRHAMRSAFEGAMRTGGWQQPSCGCYWATLLFRVPLACPVVHLVPATWRAAQTIDSRRNGGLLPLPACHLSGLKLMVKLRRSGSPFAVELLDSVIRNEENHRASSNARGGGCHHPTLWGGRLPHLPPAAPQAPAGAEADWRDGHAPPQGLPRAPLQTAQGRVRHTAGGGQDCGPCALAHVLLVARASPRGAARAPGPPLQGGLQPAPAPQARAGAGAGGDVSAGAASCGWGRGGAPHPAHCCAAEAVRARPPSGGGPRVVPAAPGRHHHAFLLLLKALPCAPEGGGCLYIWVESIPPRFTGLCAGAQCSTCSVVTNWPGSSVPKAI